MEELRLADVAACVVGWHNRHPLARRIGASHVHAIGYVALPFSGGGAAAVAPAESDAEAEPAGTLRERAEKRARQAQEPPVVVELALDRKTLKPAFSEDFIDPLPPRAVARFAQAHAQALARAPADGPLRAVRADGDAPLTLYLMTAVVETGTRKSRVLISGGAKPQVLGRRVLQRQRVALAALPLLLMGAAGAAFLPRGAPAPHVAAAPAASVPRPPAHAASASAPASAAEAPLAAAPAASAASDAAAVEAAASAPALVAASASAPQDSGDPHLGRIVMPSIKPRLNARAAAAEDAASAVAAAQRSPAPEPAAPVAAVPAPRGPATPARPEPAAAPPLPAGHSFALSTRPLRTRAEADQTRVAMKALLQAVDARGVHVDVLPEGDDWRVVGLPFTSRSEADKARALLVSRGMKVQVVGF